MVAQHAFLVGASHPPVRCCKEKSPHLRTGSFHKYGGEGGMDSLRSPFGRHGLRPFRPPGCASGRTPSGLLIPRSGAAKKRARTCVRALFSNMAVRGGLTRCARPAGVMACGHSVPWLRQWSNPVGASHPPVRCCKEKSPHLRTGSFHKYGGEGGIRTPDTLPYTHFPGVLLQPLGHLTILFCRSTAWCNGALL